MLTPLQFQKYGENDDKEKKPTTIVSATTSIHVAPIACTSCQIRNVSCDRIKPTCRECIQHSLQCQYNYNENGMTTTTITATSSSNSTTTTAALLTESTIRDPNQLREIETRLKKIETQLTARTQSSSSTSIVPLQQVQKKQTNQHSSTIVKKKLTPRFGLEPVTGGLCIETEINEAHHFIKLLFSTIHVEKIQHIAHNVFSGRLSSSMDDDDDTKTLSSLTITRNHHNNNNPLLADIKNKPLDVLLNDLLARNDDPVEQQWLNMIINTQHHRCMIFYQRVDSKYFANTDYLRQHPNDEQQRTRELLLAMALRAYIYHHEDELHQDIPFPVQTSMGPVYFQCALSLLEECYTTSHRTTIRALLHLFMYHVHDKPEDAFPYCDLAVRMTLDLNLHKKQQHDLYDYYQQHSEQQQQQHNEDNNNIINSNGYSNKQIQAEDDRRLWWAAYWCQLYTIVEYNRPTVIEDEEIEIPMPRKLSFENMDVGYCIDYCSLSIKLLRLRRSIAKALKSSDTTHALLYQVRDLETSLDEWYTDLPEHAKLPSSSSSSSQQQQQQDTLSTELGLLLHAQYYSIKLQMYECFLNNATALSLVAVNNCAKAAAGITKMLVQYGSTMRMCSCVRIVPTLYRCVTMLKYNAKFKESDGIASNAVEHLRMLGSILRCHSFKYLQEISAVIGLIDKTLELYPSIKTSPKPIVPATKSSLQPQQPSPSSVQSNIETTENINYQHQQHKMDYHLTSTHNNASAVSNQQQQQPYSFQSHHDTSISTVKQQSMNAMRHTLSTDTSSIQTQPTLPSSSITNMSHQSNTKKRQCNRQTITTNDLTNTPISSNKESFSTSSTSQMQQMAAPINGIGGFNMEQFSQEHRMNAYQQNIAPPPPSTTSSISMGSQQYGQSFPISTLTSSISDNNNDTHMTSFPQQQQQTLSTTTTLQQSSSSTDQAWTTSIPMNPETLALLGITNTGTISSAPSQPQEHFNNNILSQQSSIPSLESNNNNNNINNTQMYDSQPCTHHQDHQQQQSCMKSTFSSDNNGSNNNNRSSPFSQGSIFHRAPAVSRPSFNHTHSNNDVLIEDPYLTKFPLITPPIIASSLYQQQQQQQNYAIITELPPNLTTDDSTSNSGSNTTHFDTTSSSSHPSSSNNSITSSKSSSGNNNNNSNQRSTIQSPDSNNNYEFNTSFYQSIPFSSTSSDIDQLSFSSSSHHDQRRSPSNPPQQHYYFA